MAPLRKLSEYCEFKEYLNDALRDQLVCGLRSETIQKRLLSLKDLTLDDAFDIAVSEETAASHASELQAAGGGKTAASTDGVVQRGTKGDCQTRRRHVIAVAKRATHQTAIFTRTRSAGDVRRKVTYKRCVEIKRPRRLQTAQNTQTTTGVQDLGAVAKLGMWK